MGNEGTLESASDFGGGNDDLSDIDAFANLLFKSLSTSAAAADDMIEKAS